MSLGIYVHIPFCQRKCYYCDFYSGEYSTAKGENFTADAVKKIQKFVEYYGNLTVDTIYFGGGTPSVLPFDFLKQITDAVYKNFYCDIKEFTIEVNPNSSKDINKYGDLGINRISLGVQTLNSDLLKIIGRLHNEKEAIEALTIANRYFDNISADMMIGLPNQTDSDIKSTINILSDYSSHISQYMLTLEDGTRLKNEIDQNNRLKSLSEEEVCNQYLLSVELLKNKGFNQYEISNFCKDGKIALHNSKYWERKPYIGIGKGAHSQIDNIRFIDFFEEKIKLSDKDIYNEEIMLGLRLTKGINLNEIDYKYGMDFKKEYNKTLIKLKDFLILEEDNIRIKPEHFLIQNAIVLEFLKD